jgi:hypothetical protein
MKPFYDRMVFYQFLSMCRIRCHKTFTWWALVNACMWYGSLVNSAVLGLDAVFFGHSLVPVSVMRKTKYHRKMDEAYYDRIRHTLWNVGITLSIVDNTQAGFSLCIQRKGKSNHFIKMTAKTFVEMQFYWQGHDLTQEWFNKNVPIVYFGQVIKSPFGMPSYEMLRHKSLAFAMLKFDDEPYAAVADMDSTGDRVVAHQELIFLSEELKCQKRFLSRPNAKIKFILPIFKEVLEMSGVIDILQGNRSLAGIYNAAHKFQRRSASKWRGHKEPLKLMPCPLSVDDETRTEECGNVVMSMLELASFIKSRGKTAGTKLEVVEGYNKWWHLLGLTQMQVRSFYESINTSLINFRQQHKESSTFAKALDRLVLVVGDLHGGDFHFLSAISSLFYGAFMQPMQFATGWKQIKGSDVTKTYQQLASLATLLLGEVERGLYYAFLYDLFVGEGDDFFEQYTDAFEDCGEFFAPQFPMWLQQKVTTSTDEVLRMNILCVTITRKYVLFRQSSRNGDSTTVEWLYKYFIPIWLMVGKHNYVEIGLSQMEDLYSGVPFHVLQAIRENRFLPLHKGKTRNGQHMANWALDQVMELLQIKYKDMNFPKTQSGWQEHSTNIKIKILG